MNDILANGYGRFVGPAGGLGSGTRCSCARFVGCVGRLGRSVPPIGWPRYPVPLVSVHKKMGYAEVRAAEMNLEKVRAECKARLEQAKPHTYNHSVGAVLVGRGPRPISIVAPPHAVTTQRSGPFSRATGLPW